MPRRREPRRTLSWYRRAIAPPLRVDQGVVVVVLDVLGDVVAGDVVVDGATVVGGIVVVCLMERTSGSAAAWLMKSTTG